MNTNFFNQIAQLDITGVLQLNISKGAENNLVVSVLLNNEQCGDKAKNLIPPLILNATPQEFDDNFFDKMPKHWKNRICLLIHLWYKWVVVCYGACFVMD